mgnify:CR=1 FL=1
MIFLSRRSILLRSAGVANISHRFRIAAGILLLAALAGAGAPAGADGIWGQEKGLLVKEGGDFRFVVGEASVEVALPANVRIEGVFSLDQQALVSGVTSASPQSADGSELFLGIASAHAWVALPVPGGRRVGVSRENGVPLTTPSDELTGVAWLEGDSRQRNAVKVATWNGSGWGAIEVVAEPGPGSQLALASATLDDGATMLLWSRYDGSDDEIVFSRRVDGRWTEAQPIAADNAVPDIVPAIVAIPGGALAAWSRYDGHDYRVVLARFESGTWSAPEIVGGPGSVYPTFERMSGGARLLFESAQPHGWSVVELEGSGKIRRQTRLDTPARQRPVLVGQTARWADRELPLRWN